jgi:hypothetical protein
MSKTTEYKGVNWNELEQAWEAHITCFGVRYPCGFSNTPKGAAMLRDRKIIIMQLPHKLLQVLTPKKELV